MYEHTVRQKEKTHWKRSCSSMAYTAHSKTQHIPVWHVHERTVRQWKDTLENIMFQYGIYIYCMWCTYTMIHIYSIWCTYTVYDIHILYMVHTYTVYDVHILYMVHTYTVYDVHILWYILYMMYIYCIWYTYTVYGIYIYCIWCTYTMIHIYCTWYTYTVHGICIYCMWYTAHSKTQHIPAWHIHVYIVRSSMFQYGIYISTQ
jgi:hypothetical protein